MENYLVQLILMKLSWIQHFTWTKEIHFQFNIIVPMYYWNFRCSQNYWSMVLYDADAGNRCKYTAKQG